MTEAPEADDATLTIERARTVEVTESLTVKHKRGDGTRDQDEVRHKVELKGVFADDALALDDAALLTDARQKQAIEDATERMNDLREAQPDATEE